jgi:RES domain-containing protein
MLAWRLCRERYAKLDGIGAAKVGGRWNPIGLAMAYMSSTDALAVLEVRVHLPRYIPETYVFVTAEIPNELIERVEDHSALPNHWSENVDWTQSVGKSQDLGDARRRRRIPLCKSVGTSADTADTSVRATSVRLLE